MLISYLGFLGTGLGYCSASTTLAWRFYGTLCKMVARPIIIRNSFKEGLDVIRIKIRNLNRGENKWEIPGVIKLHA